MTEYIVKVYESGLVEWYLEGNLHREDGPAREWKDSEKQWYINGQRHRLDGPAVETSCGLKEWWQNDLKHREDGPAVITNGGYQEWWLNGKQVSKKNFNKNKKPAVQIDRILTVSLSHLEGFFIQELKGIQCGFIIHHLDFENILINIYSLKWQIGKYADLFKNPQFRALVKLTEEKSCKYLMLSESGPIVEGYIFFP